MEIDEMDGRIIHAVLQARSYGFPHDRRAIVDMFGSFGLGPDDIGARYDRLFGDTKPQKKTLVLKKALDTAGAV